MAYQMREDPGPAKDRCEDCEDWEVTLDEGDQLPPSATAGRASPQYEKGD